MYSVVISVKFTILLNHIGILLTKGLHYCLIIFDSGESWHPLGIRCAALSENFVFIRMKPNLSKSSKQELKLTQRSCAVS